MPARTIAASLPWRGVPWLRRIGLGLLFVLATVQFVGSEMYLEWPYLNVQHWEYGHAPLPFQTRLLFAPLYRYVEPFLYGNYQLQSGRTRCIPGKYSDQGY